MQEEDQLGRLRQLNNSKSVVEIQHNLEQIEIKSNKIKIQGEDSDGQQHGHQCKHDHNKKSKNPKPHAKRKKNFGIIFYTIFTCISCFYLEVYCFHSFYTDQIQRKIRSFLSSLVVFMALWSYFQTIRTKNNYVQIRGEPNLTTDPLIDGNYLSKQCEHCHYAKPPRVSHCSTCGNCIMKLDHHCIWTQNCIGFKNQRTFYLFTLYMTIGVCQFWIAAYQAFTTMYGSCKFFTFFEPGVYILWVITCFSAFFVGMMIVALLISHTMMILTNHTTLMSMKNKRMCPLPFCEFRDMILENEYTNPYDRGEIQNIRSLFGTNVFLALLPLTREIEHDFEFQAPNPVPTKGQLTEFSGGGQAQYERQQQLKLSILKLKEIYQGQKFIFNGEVIQVK